VRWMVLALAALALAGCETTQEKSARLERAALSNKSSGPAASKGLSIARPSTSIKVQSAVAVHDSEGAAIVVTLRNTGAAQKEVPLLVRAGSYSNNAQGLAPSLVRAALVPAHGETIWIDDQIQASEATGAVTTTVGEGTPALAAPPQIVLGAHRLETEPGGGTVVHGTVTNRSSTTQKELVVYVVASRGGKVHAAGRAVLTSLAAGASSPFEVFLIGRPAGTTLELAAPPTTFG
jgi:hypothetical protein